MPFQLIMVCDVCVDKCSCQLTLTLHLYHRFIAASINKRGHVKAIRGISFLKSVPFCRDGFEQLAPQNRLLTSASGFLCFSPPVSLSFFCDCDSVKSMENVGGEGNWSHAHILHNQLVSSTQLTHLSHLNYQLHFKNSSLESCTVCVRNTFQSPVISHSCLYLILSLTVEFTRWCLARDSCSSASSFDLLVPVHAWLASLLFQRYSTFPKMSSSYLLL